MGVKTAMITGDDARTANAIARELGIDEVIAGVLPDGKVATLERLREANKIAFVGDGVNDAPALAAADAGIAIGTGTDIAIEAADVVLMSGDLAKVPAALAISHATMRNIKQNLFWAFGYNVASHSRRGGRALSDQRHAALADARRGGHGAVERLRAHQCAAAAALPTAGDRERAKPPAVEAPNSRTATDRTRNQGGSDDDIQCEGNDLRQVREACHARRCRRSSRGAEVEGRSRHRQGRGVALAQGPGRRSPR